jgi:hypothetical protein
MTKPDSRKVYRKAYELRHAHGCDAHTNAARLAKECLAEGKREEHMFWKAVEVALTSRSSAGAEGPVAIWDGQYERSSSDHDSVYDEL